MAAPNNNHKSQSQSNKNSKSFKPNNNNNNNKKKKYNGNNNSFRQTESSAKLKKSKRDLERLLKKKDLPADIKHEKEKALQAINLSLQNTAHGLKAQEYARKYHMVKFFERKKAFRKYKQAKKELEALQNKLSDTQQQQQPKDNSDDESSKQTTPQPQKNTTDTAAIKKEIKKTKKKLHHCEIDLLYVYNYPKDEKYISLYPKDEKDAPRLSELPEAVRRGKKITEEERLRIKKRIQTMLDDGSLPITMDDILSGNVDHSKLEQQQRFAKLEEPDKIIQRQSKGKNNNNKDMARERQDEDQNQNDGADDDFFE